MNSHAETQSDRNTPSDSHVHSEWSWDAATGSMLKSCERAEALGLPGLAFTDHADFTAWEFPNGQPEPPWIRIVDSHASSGYLDVEGYADAIQRCQKLFPALRVRSGVEVGEPHLFSEEVESLLANYKFDRVLGSLHSLEDDGRLVYVPTMFRRGNTRDIMQRYFDEMLRMVRRSDVFEILAHIDYPMRARWPVGERPYSAQEFEEEYRAILRELARSGRVLEINTSGPWPAEGVVKWWYEEGGGAVSFGSDAHEAEKVGKEFKRAVGLAESCGFVQGDPVEGYWRR